MRQMMSAKRDYSPPALVEISLADVIAGAGGSQQDLDFTVSQRPL